MNHLNTEQIKQLKEIGAHLQQLRQKRSISIEEVAAKTFIRFTQLKALEEGQSDQLPEPVFVQGFIRRYADALGANGTALAKTFLTNSSPVELEPAIKEVSPALNKLLSVYVLYIILVVITASGMLYIHNRAQIERTDLEKSKLNSGPAIKNSVHGS